MVSGNFIYFVRFVLVAFFIFFISFLLEGGFLGIVDFLFVFCYLRALGSKLYNRKFRFFIFYFYVGVGFLVSLLGFGCVEGRLF